MYNILNQNKLIHNFNTRTDDKNKTKITKCNKIRKILENKICQSRISKFKIDNSFFIVPVYVLIYGIGFLDYLLYLCLKNAFS
ncbi:hypothetical protein PFMALIP_02285 [Plasmodium falciparum MaliPS096_E11]|uniref:Uncharacterized protein n=1 Tax=Plasmodium falciparum MaliPS096_E11 TaxID=1036727 RepID=A0A024WTA7_PLAFA|nr:hypothetical protein PFMALIP_02285 [Plasmodium falciparum MaliPS096_E11]